MHECRIGAAIGFAAALCAVTLTTPAGAQQTLVRADTGEQAAAAPADSVPLSQEMKEFEERRRRGAGYFLTGDQILRDRDQPLGYIVTAHIPGLRMVYGAHLNSQYLVSLRGEGPNALVANGGGSLCYVQVFVNGSFIVDGDISWINPADVAGIEFYDVTRTPPAYRRADGQCGVLLVWSRTGD